MRRLRLLTLAAVVATVAACAGASMDSDLGQRYAVAVSNELPHAMIITVDDGTSTRLLGTVGANREERFVLQGGQSATVTIIARDEADTLTVRRTVVLRPGGTVEVTLN